MHECNNSRQFYEQSLFSQTLAANIPGNLPRVRAGEGHMDDLIGRVVAKEAPTARSRRAPSTSFRSS